MQSGDPSPSRDDEPPTAAELLAQDPVADRELAGQPALVDEEPASRRLSSPVSRPRRLWRWLAGLTLAFLAFLLYQAATWPDVAALAETDPQTTAFIAGYQRTQQRRGQSTDVAWRFVPYGQISSSLKRAVLVAEDIGFFDHRGFALEEIEIALRETLTEGEPLRGASTLSQQLARNLWLSPSRNPWRKVKEALLTYHLERRLEKRRILELYLNVVELGPGVYGVEAASRKYFGKSASAVGDAEAARLAAALPSPKRWHPDADSKAAARRADRILKRMAKAGWLRSVI